jgi:predicted ATPase/serine/threonine protein kinase/DNA-binding CsgD family transcriptional regulator/Tfp pilus assembly protein PilF
MQQLTNGLILSKTYRLDRRIGKGGMGEVWLAQHLLLEEPRAIKVMLVKDDSGASFFRERFIKNEAKSSLRLIHPNIVRVHDLGIDYDMPYIAMEYVAGNSRGADLRLLLKNEGSISLKEAGEFLEQLAEALDYAHRQGLVHRDIKPANILLSANGSVKLSDFGIVKDLNLDNSLTEPGQGGVGTASYMSPEQINAQAMPASDIYSLGIVMYELLTGTLPFSGSRDSLILQHWGTPPPPPERFNPAIPPKISAVILQALAKKPENRFKTAREMYLAFQQALVGLQDEVSSATLPLVAKSADAPTETTPISYYGTNSVIAPNNLPDSLPEIIGRDRELAELLATTAAPKTRLITITGVGGIGKTTLATMLAKRVLTAPALAFNEGVYFGELANATNQETLLATLAQTLGVQENKEKPMLDSLTERLKDQKILLVLDNFEQLADAKVVVTQLLKASAALKIILTSRTRLNLPGEIEYSLEPLEVPASYGQDLETYPAVALFIRRAKEARRGFEVTPENLKAIVEICNRLNGLPLAIELAAARTKLLKPNQILERLNKSLDLLVSTDARFNDRQRTLRNTIDWSYQLLDAPEQKLFRRLAVFADGCTFQTAEQVCNWDNSPDLDVLTLLETLSAKHLLREIATDDGDVRCTMFQTIREYALEKLDESGETDRIYANLNAYLSDMLLSMEPNFKGAGTETALKIISAELNNIRSLLDWAISHQNSEIALRLCGEMRRFWLVSSLWSEAQSFCERTLALPAPESIERAKCLNTLAGALFYKTHLDASALAAQQSYDIARQYNGKETMSHALNALGNIAMLHGNYAEARRVYEEGLALVKELGDNWAAANVARNIGNITLHEGDYPTTISYYRQAINLQRAINDVRGLGHSYNNLGALQLRLKDYDQAYLEFLKALETLDNFKDMRLESMILCNLGLTAIYRRNYDSAEDYLNRGLKLILELGNRLNEAETLHNLGLLALRRQNYPDAKKYLQGSLIINQEVKGIRNGLENLAVLAHLTAQLYGQDALQKETAKICGGIASGLEKLGNAFEPLEQELYDGACVIAETVLGKAAYQAAFEAGKAIETDALVEMVLALPLPDQPLQTASAVVATPPSETEVAIPGEKTLAAYGLSGRELDVLRLVGQGMTDAEVAEKLVLSIRTINSHLRNIYGKLAVANRREAIRFARQHNIL